MPENNKDNSNSSHPIHIMAYNIAGVIFTQPFSQALSAFRQILNGRQVDSDKKTLEYNKNNDPKRPLKAVGLFDAVKQTKNFVDKNKTHESFAKHKKISYRAAAQLLPKQPLQIAAHFEPYTRGVSAFTGRRIGMYVGGSSYGEMKRAELQNENPELYFSDGAYNVVIAAAHTAKFETFTLGLLELWESKKQACGKWPQIIHVPKLIGHQLLRNNFAWQSAGLGKYAVEYYVGKENVTPGQLAGAGFLFGSIGSALGTPNDLGYMRCYNSSALGHPKIITPLRLGVFARSFVPRLGIGGIGFAALMATTNLAQSTKPGKFTQTLITAYDALHKAFSNKGSKENDSNENDSKKIEKNSLNNIDTGTEQKTPTSPALEKAITQNTTPPIPIELEQVLFPPNPYFAAYLNCMLLSGGKCGVNSQLPPKNNAQPNTEKEGPKVVNIYVGAGTTVRVIKTPAPPAPPGFAERIIEERRAGVSDHGNAASEQPVSRQQTRR